MPTWVLAAVSAVIWGTTWFAITFQLGKVDPLWSVAIRFALAAAVMFAWCAAKGIRPRVRGHGRLFLLGATLFGLNYWGAYASELYVTSALTGVVFSAIVFMNVVNARVFLASPIRGRMVAGAVLGVAGVVLVYLPELSRIHGSNIALGAGIAFAAAYSASLGNIVAVQARRSGLHVLQSTAWAMLYGALLMAAVSLLLGRPFHLIVTLPYLLSLGYLVVFGSVIAFSAYLTLVHRVGPERAAYATLFVPVVALAVSAMFEGYALTPLTFVGVVLLLAGSMLAMRK